MLPYHAPLFFAHRFSHDVTRINKYNLLLVSVFSGSVVGVTAVGTCGGVAGGRGGVGGGRGGVGGGRGFLCTGARLTVAV